VRDAGAAVVLVEHNFRFVMNVADVVYVFDNGKVVASGPPSAIENDPVVIESYLGGLVQRGVPEGTVAVASESENDRPGGVNGE
jgi:energy-coupling factor transporter ATP-binding protein EcfA2